MSLTVYGIKNCNTVKSALAWLSENDIDFEFHDFKAKGVTESKLKQWCAHVGWERLVNTRGTTWRQLPPALQASIKTQSAAIGLMRDKTSVIKRPVIESGDKILTLGFDVAEYKRMLK